jgi:hypothetical protein
VFKVSFLVAIACNCYGSGTPVFVNGSSKAEKWPNFSEFTNGHTVGTGGRMNICAVDTVEFLGIPRSQSLSGGV